MVLQPGNARVVELAPDSTDDNEAALRTCHMRGWVEPIVDAIPTGTILQGGHLPERLYNRSEPLYRLTDSGWAAIRRSHMLALVTSMIAPIGVVLAALTLIK